MVDQLRTYQRSLQSYAADVLRGQEDERSRLAHELHDETVQALIALDQRLQLIARTAKREPEGVVPALEMLLQSLRPSAGPQMTLTVDGAPRRLTPDQELAIYRIVQEALNNVIKHAHAERAEVKLIFEGVLKVSIGDNGVGFTVPDRVEA